MTQKVTEEQIKQWIEAHREEFVQDIIQAVNIRSVAEYGEGGYPFGTGCKKVLDHLLDVSAGYGMETQNFEDHMGCCTLKGSEGKKTIGIFSHADVVPEGTGWNYEPYNAVEEDGYLIGRGVGDNKGPAVAGLYAMRFLKEQGITLKNDVQLYFGCCEEKGMDDIVYWREHYPMPDFSIVPDANFPVCYAEKGILEFHGSMEAPEGGLIAFHGGTVTNTIPGKAYAVAAGGNAEELAAKIGSESVTVVQEGENVRIEAVGMSKHAAFPEGSVNANGLVAEALIKSGLLTGKAQKAVEFVAEVCQDYYGASIRVPYEDKESGKMTHTCSVVDFENGKMEVKFNLRYPVTSDQDVMIRTLEAFMEEKGFQIDLMENNGPCYVPLDNPIIQALCDISNEVLQADYKPYTMGGGTYARKLKNAIAFGPGIQGEKPHFPAGRGGGHQPDECIRVQGLLDGLNIYIQALLKMDELL